MKKKKRIFCYGETYRSGTRLLECFFDHTVERRAGRAPPLYHPHKDRKSERRYLKAIPHTSPENNSLKVILLQHSPADTFKLNIERVSKCCSKLANIKGSNLRSFHILASKKTATAQRLLVSISSSSQSNKSKSGICTYHTT